MLHYNLDPEVEAFSTNIEDNCNIDVILPQHQGHTSYVRRVPEELEDITGVDALITDAPGLRIGIKTADCVPVLVADKRRKAIAAIHSGWKGTRLNIIHETLERMRREFGTETCDLQAVIGPCIHLAAFEVGEDLVDAFRGDTPREEYRFARLLPHPKTGVVKWHLDLPGICRQQLVDEGVASECIELRPECTWEMHDRFYSARRLGREFGSQRILNCIMLKSPGPTAL